MKKVVMALSGGMDSTTMLAKYKSEGTEIICVNFQYGSKHNKMEAQAFGSIVTHYNVPYITVNMHEIFANIKSHLMLTGGAIPKGHYASSNMSKTVIPGRNTIIASALLGIAESNGYDTVALGVHLGDRAIYPDCRPEYVEALNTLVKIASEGKVSVEAPFITTDKAGICKIGLSLAVPYAFTRTCYTEDTIACGTCGSCCERLEAFDINEAVDPAAYIDRVSYLNFKKED